MDKTITLLKEIFSLNKEEIGVYQRELKQLDASEIEELLTDIEELQDENISITKAIKVLEEYNGN